MAKVWRMSVHPVIIPFTKPWLFDRGRGVGGVAEDAAPVCGRGEHAEAGQTEAAEGALALFHRALALGLEARVVRGGNTEFAVLLDALQFLYLLFEVLKHVFGAGEAFFLVIAVLRRHGTV